MVKRRFLLSVAAGVFSLMMVSCDLSKFPIDEIVAYFEDCDDKTWEELVAGGALTEDCRESLEEHLPENQTSHDNRLIVLTAERSEEVVTVILHGIEEDGSLLTPEELEEATYTFLDAEGNKTLLDPGDASAKLLDASDGDLFTMSLVTDYSDSMRLEDLTLISELYTDLVTDLPEVYEAEVLAFSTNVSVQQSFTEDRDDLRAGVGLDLMLFRGWTALNDAMGQAVTDLAERDRPVRIMVVATDGEENASSHWWPEQVLEAIEEEQVLVVMIGALFADVDQLERMAGERGIYFYGTEYEGVAEDVQAWIESLSSSVKVELEGAPPDATSVRIEVGGMETTAKL
jgi:hypothetical protein